MSTLNRTLRSILIAVIAVGAAAVFYLAGVGTGLYLGPSIGIDVTPCPPTQIVQVQLPTPTPTPQASATTPLPPTAAPSPTVPPRPSQSEEDAFGIFWEAWRILEDEFYGQLPEGSELPYAAIRGVIAATEDQYTAFLDPLRAEISRTDLSGSFEGIGATVRVREDGRVMIVQPLPAQPAMQSGLLPGDVILEADGTELTGMNIYEAIAIIRGPAGTTVRLLIEREGVAEPFEVLIERAHIELAVVESEMLEDGIGYVRLNEFSQTATDAIVEAVQGLQAEDLRGLVLDLRGNPGGYLSTAIEVTSQFVAEGPIMVERFKDGSERTYNPVPGGVALEVPLVVLVNGGSASASEIAAGAIQDSGRGILMGTTTLGKGSVQAVHTLSDDSQLRVTVARWFTPAGQAIHGQGLTPDIEVEMTEEDMQAGRDPQLVRAVEYLRDGK